MTKAGLEAKLQAMQRVMLERELYVQQRLDAMQRELDKLRKWRANRKA